MTWRQLRVTASGRVQGVGYRWHVLQEARRLGLRGWIRNRHNGDVEALVAGPADAVARLLELMRQGPPLAQVLTLQIQEDLLSPVPEDFEVRANG